MSRFIKLEGLQGSAWFNVDHIFSIGIPVKDGVPIVGTAVVNMPTGPFLAKGSVEDIVSQLNGTVPAKEN